MKRIVTLLLAAAMVLGAGAAQAVDVKVKGSFNFVYGVGDNLGFRDNEDDREADNFYARQRVRTQVNFIASEYLQGVVMFEIGDIWWGRGGTSGRGSGGALDADGVNIETKHAYLDFLVPNTDLSVRMGLQYLSLPMGTGYCNPVFGADVAGVVASYKFNDMFALTAFWARPFDQYRNDSDYSNYNGGSLDDEVDMFGLVAPITGDGWSVTPWFVYSRVGSASGIYEYILNYQGYLDDAGMDSLAYDQNESANAWWLGGAFSLSMFDPLTFGLDVMYGSLGNNSFAGYYDGDRFADKPFDFETKGWFIAANINYKLDWGVPGIFGWWSSGDDYDDVADGKYGRIPTVGMDDGFAATSFGTTGSIYGVDTAVSETMVGTWGIGLQIADISFIEDLSHTIRVAYYRGTNDGDLAGIGAYPISGENIYMTSKDAAWEINFDHQYQMYENLSVYLELGYIALDMDDDWNDYYDKDAFRGQVGFVYKF